MRFYSHYFGSSVDIHSGGIDLLFPHHENEEAQCCAYHNVEDWVTHWIYAGVYFTLFDLICFKNIYILFLYFNIIYF